MDYDKAVRTITGDYPQKEIDKAWKVLKNLTDEDHLESKIFLGCEYLYGIRIEQDIATGLRFLQDGLEANSKDAMYCLARHYYREGDIESYIQNLENCIEQGFILCKTELGAFLIRGYSFAFRHLQAKQNLTYQNAERGVILLREASDEKSTSASYLLGQQYFNGKIVEKDFEKAKLYFQLCIDDPGCAQYDMAKDYMRRMN